MKRVLLVFGALILFGLSSCHNDPTENVLVSREFPTSSWERFDYVENTVTLNKPVTYNAELDALFDDTYTFNYFEVVFTVFDKAGNPLRSKIYKFTLKSRDGTWKSDPEDGVYHFRFLLN